MDEKEKQQIEKIEEFEKRVTHEKPEPQGEAPTERTSENSQSTNSDNNSDSSQ